MRQLLAREEEREKTKNKIKNKYYSNNKSNLHEYIMDLATPNNPNILLSPISRPKTGSAN